MQQNLPVSGANYSIFENGAPRENPNMTYAGMQDGQIAQTKFKTSGVQI